MVRRCVINGFAVPGENPDNVALMAGAGMAVMTLLAQSNPQGRSYQVVILQRDAGHTLQPPVANFSFTDRVAEQTPPLPWTATVVSSGLIAINGNLLCFDGTRWLSATLAPVDTPPEGERARFAYGPDYDAGSAGVAGVPQAPASGSKPSTVALAAAPRARTCSTTRPSIEHNLSATLISWD